MTGFLTLISLLFFNTYSQTDECACTKDLKYTIAHIERNLPAFQVDVTPSNRKQYKKYKAKLLKRSRKANSLNDCYRIINDYVEYFADNHTRLVPPYTNIDESDPKAVTKFISSDIYKSREKIKITDSHRRQYPLEDIRGVYQTKDGAYEIAVIESRSPIRDYVGIILKSNTKLWSAGQVKVEIRETDNGYEAYEYLRNHALRYAFRFPLNNGVLGNTWYKTSKQEFVDQSRAVINNFEFHNIQDSIAYLSFPSFSNQFNAKIDSLYEASEPAIGDAKYLIIDLRDNGGGNDGNAFPFLKWMYTKPVLTDQVDLLVTKENISKWKGWYEESLQDTVNYSPEDVAWYKEIVDKMFKATLNEFIVKSEPVPIVLEKPENGPKKVAILFNRNCASSCETPLFWGMQSEKTILVGENSGGYTGYGEIDQITTPNFGYQLHYSMSKYTNQLKFEKTGIKPDYKLNYEEDWLAQTISILSKRSSKGLNK